MTYGCELWGQQILKKKALKKALISAQKKILIKVCKPCRTIKNNAICFSANVQLS